MRSHAVFSATRSLDRSHGSSTTNSSNSSWISDSSCGCHSPRSAVKQSNIVFYKRPILPPLLCGTARSEMLTYRSKALEKERKKRQHSRTKLITRVEAILSTVDITETSPSSSQESSPKIPLANSTTCEESDLHNIKINQLVLNETNETQKISYEDDNIAACTLKDNSECPETTAEPETVETSTEKEVNTSTISSSSSGSDGSFQTTAYRKSLQNLLQKSINSSLNDTFTMPEKSKPEQPNEAAPSLSGTSSTTTENIWANNTQATIVPKTREDDTSLSSTVSHTPSVENADNIRQGSAANDCSDTDAIADSMVDSVLEEVRSELTMYASFQIDSGSIHSIASETDKPKTGDELNIVTPNTPNKANNVNSDNDENLDLSCTASEQINQALTIIGSQLADDLATKQQTESPSSSDDSVQENISPVLTPKFNWGETSADGPTISTVTPETIALISSYQLVLESEETPQATEDIESISEHFDKHNVTEIENGENVVKQNFQTVNDNEKVSPSETAILVKLQRQSEGRTRSNSYSTHAPSPLLINSREEHT
uniref:Dentin sialophosphoprotein-like n=1 Tax=Phallusia mammillata TaxID=59560 RepID=A0A6F9DC71_9ASCI|nr:dentin sialophosphoprotein-like [Phallusia mammillata]